MQVALALSPSFAFALPSAVRAFLYLQGSAGTFPYRPFEVYTPVHGVYTMFGTYRQVL